MKTTDEYMHLPYRVVLTPDEDEDGQAGWVAEVAELPGCLSQGASPDEAVENVRDAMRGWISVALEDGREIPVPREVPPFSGRFLVRIPRTLHAELSAAAKEEGVSLNQYVAVALARAVGHTRERVLT